MAIFSQRAAAGLCFALSCLAWGAAAWVAATQAPLVPADLTPEVSASPPAERQMSAQLLPPVSRPDGRKPLEPSAFDVAALEIPGLAALSADEQALALAVLNMTTGACDPCQVQGLSIAACLVARPSGCENMPGLAQRVLRLAASGTEVNAARAAVRYDDSWLPVPPGGRPARGGGEGAVTLIVAVDYISPFSAQAEPSFDALLQRFGDDLRVEVLQVPRPDRAAMDAATAALAAELAGCFWPAHAALLRAGGQGDPRETAEAACGQSLEVRRDEAKARLRADMALGEALGVRGTPTTFVNGYRVRGLRGEDEYARLIQLELDDRGR